MRLLSSQAQCRVPITGLPAPAARLGAPTSSSASAPSAATMGSSGSNSNAFNSNNSSYASDSQIRSPYAGTLLGRLISNQPGNSSLLGSQNPVMLIQKRMAGECQVGKKATVIITVRNAGNSTAQDVEVIDSVPVEPALQKPSLPLHQRLKASWSGS